MNLQLRPEESGAFAVVERLESLARVDPARHSARLAWRYSWLADHYLAQGNDDEYLACYERAAVLMRERVTSSSGTLGERWDLCQHLFNVASVALRIGQPSSARAALDEAEARVEALNSEPCPLRMGREDFVSGLAALRTRAVAAEFPDSR